jgi:hypothetical protein
MYRFQTRDIGQQYLTIWWTGCITFLVGIAISLVIYYEVFSLLESLRTMKILPVTGMFRFLPIPLSAQVFLCLLFIAGLIAIVGLCRWRQAPLRVFLLCYIPMLVVFLLYALSQGMADLHLGAHLHWNIVFFWIGRTLLMVPSLLLVISYCFFILSTVAFLRKLWAQYH